MRDYKSLNSSFSNSNKNSLPKKAFTLVIIIIILVGVTFLFDNFNTPNKQTIKVEQNSTNTENKEKIIIPLELPKQSFIKIQHKTPTQNIKTELTWRTHPIIEGDTLSSIFNKYQFSKKLLHNISTLNKDTRYLSRIKAGQIIAFLTSPKDKLLKLRYAINETNTLIIDIDKGSIASKIIKQTFEKRISHVSATISNSLFLSAHQAGLPDRLTMELADIFGWDIDFALDIRANDHFTVIFEELYSDGEKVKNGHILAAEFINDGKVFKAVRYMDHNNNIQYYTPNGKSLKKAFLRSPVKFSRISSKFTLKRWHPILHRFKSHKGVDYAASTGTPIKATGNGKIAFRGRKGGYGKTIVIEHGNQYSTLYAHLSRFSKARTGKRVKQGDTIGYVGKTGLATGPHLHYEFRVNNRHRNPLTIKLPKTRSIRKHYMTAFKNQTKNLLAQLEMYKKITVALK